MYLCAVLHTTLLHDMSNAQKANTYTYNITYKFTSKTYSQYQQLSSDQQPKPQQLCLYIL